MQHCRNKYNKDQGNVRAIINDQGTLEEVNNYYPFGVLAGSATAGVQPLKLESKELDRENGLDLYDFQTRQQDPTSTLFTTQDPLCEQDFGTSPYAYCAGNPVRYIDPTGMIIRSSFDGVDYDYRLGDDGRYDFFDQQGNPYNGCDQFAYTLLVQSLSSISEGFYGGYLIGMLISDKKITQLFLYEKNVE